MTRLPESKVNDAKVLLQKGMSLREVASTLRISVGAVQRIREREKENIPAPKIGRPSKISKRTKVHLARDFDTGKLTSLHDGKKLIQSIEGVQVHTETVRRYLKSQHVKAYIKPKKPKLTKDHIASRYKFATEHLDWDVDKWSNVMFSDETIFSMVGSFGRQWYYKRPTRKRLEPHMIKETVQSGGGKLMMWGCMTYYGLGDACWIKENLNAERYVEILSDYVPASRDWYGMEVKDFVFQHDNSKIHTSWIATKFLKERKIKVLDWPSRSPELNPIENLWSEIERRLDDYKEASKTIDELWDRIQDAWCSIPISYIRSLYESMPRRMQKLKDNKGGHINY